MNALEAIRKKESDHKGQIAALEAQIAEDSAAGNRNITVLNQLDALKRTHPVAEDERLKAFQDHGLPVIRAYMEPFETALQEARTAYINAYAEYAAAGYKAETAANAWGRSFYPRPTPSAWDIKIASEAIPEKTVGSVSSCDDTQITE
jgi:predicted  nucleic acid-binding Zn-ribbon protein